MQFLFKNNLKKNVRMIFKEQTKSVPITKAMVWESYKKVKSNRGSAGVDHFKFFDNVSHNLLFKALERHVSEKWVLLYIRRWLEAPVLLENGTLEQSKGKGTPQGGVISPLLSNLYMHYCVDKWLDKHYPLARMIRYADDLIIHCHSYEAANHILATLKRRLSDCGLTAHPEKTKIVYCKKDGRNLKGYPVQFDFLGFSFQPIRYRLKNGGSFMQFDCKMSRKSKTRITRELRKMAFHNKTQRNIQDLANLLNPKIRGWVWYYGKIRRRSLRPVFYYLHHRMISWILNKYKRFKRSRVKAVKWLRSITKSYPNMFYHWELGYKLV